MLFTGAAEVGQVAAQALALFVIAFIIESSMEYLIALPLKNAGIPTKLIIPYVALVVSFLGAWAFDLKIGELFNLVTEYDVAAYILTALPISRGANFISDLLGRLKKG